MSEKVIAFRFLKRTGKSCLDYIFFAEVDVEVVTGVLFWKNTKVETRQVGREYCSTFWSFTDTGEFTTGNEAEKLERAYMLSNPDCDLNFRL